MFLEKFAGDSLAQVEASVVGPTKDALRRL
jgi:hypothetical protein